MLLTMIAVLMSSVAVNMLMIAVLMLSVAVNLLMIAILMSGGAIHFSYYKYFFNHLEYSAIQFNATI